jgi:hypothetical protein
MNKINQLSNDSSTLKASCAHNAKDIAKTPIPYWMCGVDLMDLHAERKSKELDLSNKQSGFKISMIEKILLAGKTVFAFRLCNIFKANRP